MTSLLTRSQELINDILTNIQKKLGSINLSEESIVVKEDINNTYVGHIMSLMNIRNELHTIIKSIDTPAYTSMYALTQENIEHLAYFLEKNKITYADFMIHTEKCEGIAVTDGEVANQLDY